MAQSNAASSARGAEKTRRRTQDGIGSAKYKYGPEDRALLSTALTGGQGRKAPPILGGAIELILLSVGVLSLLIQAADSRAVASLFTKIIGNVVSDPEMPAEVKKRAILGFFVSSLREYPEEMQAIIERMDTLDESDQQALADMVRNQENADK